MSSDRPAQDEDAHDQSKAAVDLATVLAAVAAADGVGYGLEQEAIKDAASLTAAEATKAAAKAASKAPELVQEALDGVNYFEALALKTNRKAEELLERGLKEHAAEWFEEAEGAVDRAVEQAAKARYYGAAAEAAAATAAKFTAVAKAAGAAAGSELVGFAFTAAPVAGGTALVVGADHFTDGKSTDALYAVGEAISDGLGALIDAPGNIYRELHPDAPTPEPSWEHVGPDFNAPGDVPQ
jgi:hypothetical protein